MPNILNLVSAYEYYKSLPNFDNPQQLDPDHKRLSPNLDTGDFAAGEYDIHLENDFNRLCIYDNLIRIDIKEFYGRLYTHYIDFNSLDERYITNLNKGATNGLIMGNYLSLYFAEDTLSKISEKITTEFQNQNINCKFSYFSDDFYFFCNTEDNDKVIKIFDNILEDYGLERSDNKKEIWTYETYNAYNVVTRHWKRLIATCNIRYNVRIRENKMVFINQLLYRSSKLDNDKLKRVFINNFFKTKYFRELDLSKFKFKYYDYHQICYLLKLSPEALLYSMDKLSTMRDFKQELIYNFFKVRYRESLKKSFYEVQLYYYYALKLLEYNDIIIENKNLVLISGNQVLISYYLSEGIFDVSDIAILKTKNTEEFWFQSYHLILYTNDLLLDLENSIEQYLIPDATKPDTNASSGKLLTKNKRKKSYMDFYKSNLIANRPIIRDVNNICLTINDYLALKFEEEEALYI